MGVDIAPRRRAIAIAAAAGLALACSRGSAPRAPVEPLSVVLVTLDTTRADRIGAFGGSIVPTPHLDRIAAEGVKFTEAISQVPLTLPSHATMFTGRYPASHGARHNGIYRLPEADVTLAEVLKEQGFETAAFVGAFVVNEGFGLNQGFDVYDDIEGGRYQGETDRLFEAQRTAEEVNAAVYEWLKRPHAGRVFLWVHYYDAHEPYAPPERPGLVGTGYDREISYVDATFGDLMERLRGAGLLDRSLLVVAGDHGESLGEHMERTHGVFLYEGALHVPFMLRAPGLIPAGGAVDGPVGLVDLAPTVLDLLGLPPLEQAEGASLRPRIFGEKPRGARRVYAETLMPRLEFGWSELRMVRDERFKYIQAPRAELYDLREDPGESHNLLAEQPRRVAEMSGLLEQWVASTGQGEGPAQAARQLSPEEEEKLRSLGYLGGSAFKAGDAADGEARPDPKDQIAEAIKLNRARDLLHAGSPVEALELATQILQKTPTNRHARQTRVQALIRLDRLEEAELEAEAALTFAEHDPDASPQLVEKARRMLASVYWMRGKNAEAEKQYHMAIEMNRENGGAPVFPGLLLGTAAGMDEAKQIVRGVLERNPDDPAALAAKFELEHAEGEREAALHTAERLAQLGAGDAPTLIKAGRMLDEAGKPALAASCFEAALAKADHPSPDVLGFLGTSRLHAGDLAGATEAFEQVRALRPDDPRTPFFLGNIALLNGDESRARELYDESLRLNPQFVPPLVNLAEWLASRGRAAEAIDVLEGALERRPGDPGATRVLARLTGGTQGDS